MNTDLALQIAHSVSRSTTTEPPLMLRSFGSDLCEQLSVSGGETLGVVGRFF